MGSVVVNAVSEVAGFSPSTARPKKAPKQNDGPRKAAQNPFYDGPPKKSERSPPSH